MPISRYHVSTHYLWAGLAAVGFSAFSAWLSLGRPVCWIATALLIVSASAVLFLATRPPIEIYESHLKIGETAIPWRHVRRVDRSLSVPLIVRLTLSDKTRMLLVYPGDPNSTGGLLRNLRRCAREALIDGVPYRQFWGDAPAKESKKQTAARTPLLLPDDEAEVERMFQQLKAVGRFEEKTSSEDK